MSKIQDYFLYLANDMNKCCKIIPVNTIINTKLN